MRKTLWISNAAVLLFVLLTFAPGAHAAALYYDRASFETAYGGSTSTINFDGMSAGTDLTGDSILGVTFNAPGSTPLEVIAAATGVRYSMSTSTSPNVLSPGGSNGGIEDDDLRLVFDTPVMAAGLDVVFDVPDGASYVGVFFYDEFNNLLASNGFIPCPGGFPGYQFVGFVADSALIKSVLFDEFDGSFMDDNVAYDTVTFSSSAVPLPSALLLFAPGLAGLAIRRRFKG